MKTYDVIIVGGGCAGLSCARSAAAGGLDVLLLDRRRQGHPGHDWCDVVDEPVFREIGLDTPPAEFWRPVTLPVFYTPDMSASIHVRAGEETACPHLYIDRKLMNRWLLGFIESRSNVEIRTGCEVLGPEIRDGRVTGVFASGGKPGAPEVMRAGVVVDAGGLRSPIGQRIPYAHPFRPDPVIDRDAFIGIKEMLPVDDAGARERIGNRILMGYGRGMAWTMVYRENLVDVGIAIPLEQGPHRVKRLLEELKTQLGLSSLRPVRRGGGLLPARRCRTRLAGDGYLIAGDAACQINPANGGGIAPALLAGHIAGETLVRAARTGRFDCTSLWPYPVRYVNRQGAAFAGLDRMRICFQALEKKEISLLFRNRVIQLNDLAVPFIHGRRPALDVFSRLRGVARSLSRPDLLAKLSRSLLSARSIEKAYRAIPAVYNEKAVAGWEDKIREKAISGWKLAKL